MNQRLLDLFAEARALPSADQDDLANLLSAFVASRAATFTAEELAHIDRFAAEPFVEADRAEIESLFGRRLG